MLVGLDIDRRQRVALRQGGQLRLFGRGGPDAAKAVKDQHPPRGPIAARKAV